MSRAYKSINPITASTVQGKSGMTLLEHYAGLAMQGTCLSITDLGQERHVQHAAEFAVKMAKALIAELEKEAK